MITNKQRVFQVIAISALAFGLAACNKADENKTAGQQLDTAIAKTEQAADQAKVDADRAVQAAGQSIENGAEKVADAASNAAEATKDAASDALAIASEAGTTAKVNAALIKDPDLSALKIDVDTKGNAVTLNGTAPTQAAKDRATEIAKAVEGVGSVNNLLTVQ